MMPEDEDLNAGEIFGIFLMTVSAVGLVITIINGISCIMNPC